jgi:hypothetical protein
MRFKFYLDLKNKIKEKIELNLSKGKFEKLNNEIMKFNNFQEFYPPILNKIYKNLLLFREEKLLQFYKLSKFLFNKDKDKDYNMNIPILSNKSNSKGYLKNDKINNEIKIIKNIYSIENENKNNNNTKNNDFKYIKGNKKMNLLKIKEEEEKEEFTKNENINNYLNYQNNFQYNHNYNKNNNNNNNNNNNINININNKKKEKEKTNNFLFSKNKNNSINDNSNNNNKNNFKEKDLIDRDRDKDCINKNQNESKNYYLKDIQNNLKIGFNNYSIQLYDSNKEIIKSQEFVQDDSNANPYADVKDKVSFFSSKEMINENKKYNNILINRRKDSENSMKILGNKIARKISGDKIFNKNDKNYEIKNYNNNYDNDNKNDNHYHNYNYNNDFNFNFDNNFTLENEFNSTPKDIFLSFENFNQENKFDIFGERVKEKEKEKENSISCLRKYSSEYFAQNLFEVNYEKDNYNYTYNNQIKHDDDIDNNNNDKDRDGDKDIDRDIDYKKNKNIYFNEIKINDMKNKEKFILLKDILNNRKYLEGSFVKSIDDNTTVSTKNTKEKLLKNISNKDSNNIFINFNNINNNYNNKESNKLHDDLLETAKYFNLNN